MYVIKMVNNKIEKRKIYNSKSVYYDKDEDNSCAHCGEEINNNEDEFCSIECQKEFNKSEPSIHPIREQHDNMMKWDSLTIEDRTLILNSLKCSMEIINFNWNQLSNEIQQIINDFRNCYNQ